MRHFLGFTVSAVLHGALLFLLLATARTDEEEIKQPKLTSIELAMFESPPPAPATPIQEELPAVTEPAPAPEPVAEPVAEAVPESAPTPIPEPIPAEPETEGPTPEEIQQAEREKALAEQRRIERERVLAGKRVRELEKKREEERQRQLAEQRRREFEQKQAAERQRQLVEQRRREWEAKKAEEERQKQLAEQRRSEFEQKQAAERQRQLVEQRRREWEAKKAEAAKAQQLADQRRREWEANKARAAAQQRRQQNAARQQQQRPVAPASVAAAQSAGVPLITNPGLQSRTTLVYPRRARSRGLEGQVIVRANVTPTGHVSSLQVHRSSGHDVLDKAALRSVKQWVFKPAMKNNIAVASIVQIPVTFRLQ